MEECPADGDAGNSLARATKTHFHGQPTAADRLSIASSAATISSLWFGPFQRIDLTFQVRYFGVPLFLFAFFPLTVIPFCRCIRLGGNDGIQLLHRIGLVIFERL